MITLGKLGRLGSAAGLVLAGLCLLLPFLTASQTDGGDGRWQITYAGTDLITGGKPDFHLTDGPEQDPVDQLVVTQMRQILGEQPAPLPAQPVAWLALALTTAALAATALRSRIWRLTLTAGLALAAAPVLWGAVILARQDAADALAGVLIGLWSTATPPPAQIRQWDQYGHVRDMFSHGYGFWIAVAALVAVGVVNTAGLLRPEPAD